MRARRRDETAKSLASTSALGAGTVDLPHVRVTPSAPRFVAECPDLA